MYQNNERPPASPQMRGLVALMSGIKLGTCVPEQRAPASVASDAGARCADVRLYPFRIKLGTCVPEQRAPASVASDAGARCADVRLYPFRIKLGTCVPEQRAPGCGGSLR